MPGNTVFGIYRQYFWLDKNSSVISFSGHQFSLNEAGGASTTQKKYIFEFFFAAEKKLSKHSS